MLSLDILYRHVVLYDHGKFIGCCTQFLRRQRWPSTTADSLGTSDFPHPPILVRRCISWLHYGLLSLRPIDSFALLSELTGFPQPTRTFTSGLPTDWSPAPPPDIATGATGQVTLTGLSPVIIPTSIAAPAVSIAPPKIPYGEFSSVRLQGWYFKRGLPSSRALPAAGLPSPFVPLASTFSPRTVSGNVLRWCTSTRAASAALPQGSSLRSGL